MGGAPLCLGARSLWDTPGRRLDQPSTNIRPVGVLGDLGGDPRPSGSRRASGSEPSLE